VGGGLLLQMKAFEGEAELALGDIVVWGGGSDFLELGPGAGVGLLFEVDSAEIAAGERVIRVLGEDLAENGGGFFGVSAVEGDLDAEMRLSRFRPRLSLAQQGSRSGLDCRLPHP
jgi:hypothetical protein